MYRCTCRFSEWMDAAIFKFSRIVFGVGSGCAKLIFTYQYLLLTFIPWLFVHLHWISFPVQLPLCKIILMWSLCKSLNIFLASSSVIFTYRLLPRLLVFQLWRDKDLSWWFLLRLCFLVLLYLLWPPRLMIWLLPYTSRRRLFEYLLIPQMSLSSNILVPVLNLRDILRKLKRFAIDWLILKFGFGVCVGERVCWWSNKLQLVVHVLLLD